MMNGTFRFSDLPRRRSPAVDGWEHRRAELAADPLAAGGG